MPDEPSLGEVVRRLDRLESRLEELLREMGLRVVSVDLYARDQREIERRFTEMERDLLQEVEARKAALVEERTARENGDREIKNDLGQQGTNWRQTLYSGLLPTLFLVITLAIQIWLARAGR